MKEPAITLFGTKIVLPAKSSGGGSGGKFSGESESLDLRREEEGGGDEIIMKVQINQEEDQESGEAKPQEKNQNPGEAEDSQHTTANDKSEESDDNPKTPSIGEEVKDVAPTESDATNAEQNQKTQKKPDNILPCPRCKSMDTKFCYYNNYNILQPRHFCKACQRYWTAGGTMRNVPVGAGRRKNKNPATDCRPLTISEAHHAGANIDARNGRVLSFGQNSASAAATVLSPTGQRLPNGVRNASFSGKIGENKDDGSSGSSISTANIVENGGNLQNMNVVPPHNVPCIPGVPWPYPWNAAVPMPAICPGPGYPMPYYPAAPFWPNAVPWLSVPSPSSSSISPLGKHSRDGELINSKAHLEPKRTSESSIVVPKTLRGDDPEEAAKSSIWSTLGLKYYENSREGLFKSLQPKDDEKKATVDATSSSPSPALTANPAALSRSAIFRERA